MADDRAVDVGAEALGEGEWHAHYGGGPTTAREVAGLVLARARPVIEAEARQAVLGECCEQHQRLNEANVVARDEARAEAARLREALERIATAHVEYRRHGHGFEHGLYDAQGGYAGAAAPWMQETARAALAGEAGGREHHRCLAVGASRCCAEDGEARDR